MLSLVFVAALALLAPASARTADISAAEEAAVRNAIDDALNNVRDIILNGDAELGIPVLDPLVVDEWEFAVDEEPLVSAEGSLSQARLEGLGAFVVEVSKISFGVLPPRATVTVGVRVPAVSAVGNYRLSGEAHTRMRTDISVDADGDFTVVVKDISFLVKAVINLGLGSYKVKSIGVTLGLGDIFIDVRGAGDAGDLINAEAADRIQIWFTENRPALEEQAAAIIKEAIESSLGKRSQLLDDPAIAACLVWLPQTPRCLVSPSA